MSHSVCRGHHPRHAVRAAALGVMVMMSLQTLLWADTAVQPQALESVGVRQLRQQRPELDGRGVTVAVVARSFNYTHQGQPVNDYRPDVTHESLQTALIDSFDLLAGTAGISPHATAVCSILLGLDANGYFPDLGTFVYEGVVPAAAGRVVEFETFWKQSVFSDGRVDADVVSISCGSDQPGRWSRGIDALIDRQGVTVVGSIGNGSEAGTPPLYPGAGQNVLGVGVVDAVTSVSPETTLSTFGLARPEHTSCGPTADLRCKPDLVAPGNCLVAAAGEPNAYTMSGNWSSYAAPLVAGVAALVIQAAREVPETASLLNSSEANCLVKSWLMNSARKLPYWHKGALGTEDDERVPLDYAQGAGMVDAAAALEQMAAGRHGGGEVPDQGWDVNTVGTDPESVRWYRMTVEDPGQQWLTATLNWNRHFAGVASGFSPLGELDGDLRLELWAIDPNGVLPDVRVAVSDSPVDNVEHLHGPLLPEYHVYEIQVLLNESASLAPDYVEVFALSWNVERPEPVDEVAWYDLNSDGVVDYQDRQVLHAYWMASQQSEQAYALGDVNRDGTIDEADFRLLASKSRLRATWRQQ